MKKNIFYIMAACVLALCSCSQEFDQDVTEVVEGIPTTVSLPFTVGGAEKVSTKLTLGDSYEGTLYNLMILIYQDGALMYSKYFEQGDTAWSHVQEDSAGHGTVDIDTYTANNCSIYAVANINVAMINLSPEKLKTVGKTEAGLQKLVAKLNQEIVSRDGFFLMSGWMKGVNISSTSVEKTASATDSQGRTAANVKLTLARLDSKITFNVKCAAPDDPAHQPTIESFTPKKWQVVNLPLRSYLISGVASNDYTTFGNSEENYFSTPRYGMFHETAATDGTTYDTTSWSFYAIESILAPKNNVTSFAERDRQVKEDGTGFNLEFANAPDYGTYVILTGTVTMSKVEYTPTGVLQYKEYGQTLNAEVQYKIHLGDFSTDFNDYCIKRNTDYTYNVTIKGVDDITIEVITSDSTDEPGQETEPQPGATGDITLALEAFKTVDAHYESFVHKFNYKNINQDMTWFVSTPFSQGQAASNPADYKWIKFMINKKSGGVYVDNRRTFKPYTGATIDNTEDYSGNTTPTMTVRELVTYLKAQAQRKADGLDNQFDTNDQIGVTVFVDEFYYDEDPRDGSTSTTLWKKFVGNDVEPRVMHILSRTMGSYDEESWVTASTLSIKQLTIQSVYNPDSDVERLWGSEQIEESPVRRNMGWNSSGKTRSYSIDSQYNHNGRYTSLREWGVRTSAGAWNDTQNWSTFVDWESEGDTIRMKDDYNYLAYMCMTRNRDNDGDGKLDHDEVRWYLATEDQIQELWIGDVSLSTRAKYYNPFPNKIDPLTGKPFWRCHYVTGSYLNSTSTSSPCEIWAEERGATGALYGAEGSTYNKVGGRTASGPLHVRCMRNINTNLDHAYQNDATYQPLVTVSGSNTDGWEFDLSRLAETNFREFRSQELIFGSDVSTINNRVARKFGAAPVASNKSFTAVGFEEMNNDSRVGIGKQNPYCPTGYRLPNNREILLMYVYLPTNFWTASPSMSSLSSAAYGFMTRTYSDVFRLGQNLDSTIDQVSLMITRKGTGISASISQATTNRCVKDVFYVSVDD